MLAFKDIIGLRMERQCLTKHADKKEYKKLYRDLSPGLNEYWHGFGQPPCLQYRTDFDDVEYNGKRQLKHQIVKGRFQNGNIGFIEANQMELFAGLYNKPYKGGEYGDMLLSMMEREGPMSIEVIKEMSGLLVKQITPALKKLQEAFLIFEDQDDGEWDRGWCLLSEMFPDIQIDKYTRREALMKVLPGLLYRYVYLTLEGARSFYGLPKKDLKLALGEMEEKGQIVPWKDGYVRKGDIALLEQRSYPFDLPILVLHRNDPLVRCEEHLLKQIYKSSEKGTDVLQYLLVDGEIKGAVMGHFRYGPYDLHSIWLSMSKKEAEVRGEEILKAVYYANGEREEDVPFTFLS